MTTAARAASLASDWLRAAEWAGPSAAGRVDWCGPGAGRAEAVARGREGVRPRRSRAGRQGRNPRTRSARFLSFFPGYATSPQAVTRRLLRFPSPSKELGASYRDGGPAVSVRTGRTVPGRVMGWPRGVRRRWGAGGFQEGGGSSAWEAEGGSQVGRYLVRMAGWGAGFLLPLAREEAEHDVPKCACTVPEHWPQVESQQGGWAQ